jgi:hypothetical protein
VTAISQQAAHAAFLAVHNALTETHAVEPENAEGKKQRRRALDSLREASAALFQLAVIERLHQ